MQKTWILIDLLYLAHRARFSMRGFSADETPTGILFGFFEQLLHVCSLPMLRSNQVAVFVDSKESWRTKDFPAYKQKRATNRTEEEWAQIRVMYDQVNELHFNILPSIGIPVYGQQGLESDDLMAWSAAHLTEQKEKGIMVTGDSDLWQAITDYVSWYDPQRDILHTPKTLKAQKGIFPSQWGFVKALGGCSTDGVPGIKGVSEKGACDYINNKLPHHHKKYRLIREALANGEVDYWKKLVELPHKKTKPIALSALKYQPEVFYEFCKKYQIESYLSGAGRRRWDSFFNGTFSGTPMPRVREKTATLFD